MALVPQPYAAYQRTRSHCHGVYSLDSRVVSACVPVRAPCAIRYWRAEWHKLTKKQIEEIVSQVLRTLQQNGPVTAQPVVPMGASSARAGVFGTAAEAIAAAKTAQAVLVKLGFAKRREIIEAIKEVSLANAKRLADLAVQDTKMGNAGTQNDKK